MKKMFFIASMMLATVFAQAQLKVNQYGRVLINSNETVGAGYLNVGKPGDGIGISVKTGSNCIEARRTGSPSGPSIQSTIVGYNEPYDYYYSIGLQGQADATTPTNAGRAFGVMGEAGNTTSGYNYGIYGSLYGAQNGTAIYGTTQSDIGINVGGRYAGYFNGDVKVTGTLYAPVLTTTAASSNIATAQVALTEANNTTRQTVSDRLAQLSAVQYNISIPMPLATMQMAATSSATRAITSGDTIEVAYPTDIELQAIEKNHYGLMAAQLQQVYPDLVYENQQGDLCINYIEMIPLLVESIKELKAEINTLQSGNTGGAVVMSRASFGATDIEEATVLTIPMLKQNNPNPFTENTVIEYSLPESVQTANLYIYDMNGSQIQQITLTERGDSSITVNGGELNAGMYLYSLIADGKVIDTKRMILTK